ncbi:hypothetical protein GCM10023063_19850 [Arthrobacter methylotrophus]|uniref:PknH-like extracellular domain-containing protein n=1 Tax=Arthrobacter methylotrophus TaxID=121291 RepID=A0ABV5URM4_9MICC
MPKYSLMLATLIAGAALALSSCVAASQATPASPPAASALSSHTLASSIGQDQLPSILLDQKDQAALQAIGGQLDKPRSNTVGYIADLTKSYSPDAAPICLFNRDAPLDGSENKSDNDWNSAVWSVEGGSMTLESGNILGGSYLQEAARAFPSTAAATSHLEVIDSHIRGCAGYTDINGSKFTTNPDPQGTFGPGTISWVESVEMHSKTTGAAAYPDGTKSEEQNVEFKSRNVVVRVATLGLTHADVQKLIDAAKAMLDAL